MRAVICSPNAMVRLCVKVVLTDDGTQIIAEVANAADLDLRLNGSGRADVVVLHGHVGARPPKLHRVVMVVQDGDANGAAVLRALRRGIGSVVSADSDLEALPRACRLTVEGSGYVSPSLVAALRDHLAGSDRGASARFGLTAREALVLRLLATGRPVTDIARELKVAPRTVKHNLSCIYRKLDVANATEAVARAYMEGLTA